MTISNLSHRLDTLEREAAQEPGGGLAAFYEDQSDWDALFYPTINTCPVGGTPEHPR